MGKKIYIGNLAFSVTENLINELFSQYGTVDSCRLITDRDTGRSKGFGFVEMSTDEETEKAISSLNGHQLEGRALTVNEARPQAARPDRSSFRNSFGSSNNRFASSGQRRGRSY